MPGSNQTTSCTAFDGRKRIATGPLAEVARKAKEHLDRHTTAQILVFDDHTSEPVELDLRGTPEDVVARLRQSEAEPRRPGRPKLGVVAREVTLLPRHWEWLATQPGGASVSLRRLVDQARKSSQDRDELRRAQEAAYRFLSAMAGNEPGFEEAIRALFGSQEKRFTTIVEPWPRDIRDHAKRLAAEVFARSAPKE
jgi:hypothetical protein